MWGQNKRAVIVGFEEVIAWQTRTGSLRNESAFGFLPGALQGLRMLEDNGYIVLAVDRKENRCCSKSASERQQLIQRMRLDVALAGGRIQQVYGWRNSDVAYAELLQRAMAEHGLRASNTVLVSDSLEEVAAAAWLGCNGILLRRNAFLEQGRPAEQSWNEIASNLREVAERLIQTGRPTLGELLEKKMTTDAMTIPQGYFLRHAVVDCYGNWGDRQNIERHEEMTQVGVPY